MKKYYCTLILCLSVLFGYSSNTSSSKSSRPFAFVISQDVVPVVQSNIISVPTVDLHHVFFVPVWRKLFNDDRIKHLRITPIHKVHFVEKATDLKNTINLSKPDCLVLQMSLYDRS